MALAKKRHTPSELKHKVLDEVRFLKSWVEKPLQVGAVAPSSPALARLMASYVDPAAPGGVLELGPGTGVVTKALLDRGVPADRVVSVEYSPDFCKLLRQRFPGIHVVHGDAYQVRHAVAGETVAGETVAGKTGAGKTGAGKTGTPFGAVVSSLPLFTRPLPHRVRLLEECFDLMEPGAPFIQFSYALVPPIPAHAGRFVIERTAWVVMNLPPARVWIYRRPA